MAVKVKRLLRADNDEVAIFVALAEDISGFKRGRVPFCASPHETEKIVR
jgi:hypothetical protein